MSKELIEEYNKPSLGDVLYYAQILPRVGVYNLCDIKVCTLYDTYFAGIDTGDKRRYVFNYSEINQTIFENRLEALETIKEAEENKPIVSDEIYYEED